MADGKFTDAFSPLNQPTSSCESDDEFRNADDTYNTG